MPDKRVFIALHYTPSPEFIQFFTQMKKEMGTTGIKWTELHNLHLTLQFLGDTPEEGIRELSQELETIARNCHGFLFTPGKPGYFGAASSPRVIWMSLEEPSGRLALLANTVRDKTRSWTAGDDKPFLPHLTLARPKITMEASHIKKYMAEWAKIALPPVSVTQFHLIWSTLTPRGPVYKNLRSFDLLP